MAAQNIPRPPLLASEPLGEVELFLFIFLAQKIPQLCIAQKNTKPAQKNTKAAQIINKLVFHSSFNCSS
jgi:hypothetical protein